MSQRRRQLIHERSKSHTLVPTSVALRVSVHRRLARRSGRAPIAYGIHVCEIFQNANINARECCSHIHFAASIVGRVCVCFNLNPFRKDFDAHTAGRSLKKRFSRSRSPELSTHMRRQSNYTQHFSDMKSKIYSIVSLCFGNFLKLFAAAAARGIRFRLCLWSRA